MSWGIAIPGLAMHSRELPALSGLRILQNPGVGDVPDFAGAYDLREVAITHLKSILDAVSQEQELLIIGMSMGGMVASILASELRSELPKQTKFRFLVTSVNSRRNPCIPASTLAQWQQARPGDVASFEKILQPFVSFTFRSAYPDLAHEYYRYRAFGENGQSAKSLYRQIEAVQNFDGTENFAMMDPSECSFIHGGEDRVMNSTHHRELMEIQPSASHKIISNLGHMINFEAPHWFERVEPK